MGGMVGFMIMLFFCQDTSRQLKRLSQGQPLEGGGGCTKSQGGGASQQTGIGGGLQPSMWPCILGRLEIGGYPLIELSWLLSLYRSLDCLYITFESIKYYNTSLHHHTPISINQLRTNYPFSGVNLYSNPILISIPLDVIILSEMKSVIRKLVAGPKKKTPFNGQQLDLTYITDRIIAMAYPASNFFEKAYRNSIDDVASYFNEYHKNNYLIINVSCRPYDYSKFGGRVREYEWADHQAPPITTLVEIAHEIKQYLEQNGSGVVAVHCNHGKGRTGTAIIGFMLYMALYERAADALAFYNSQRFSSEEYGVDQPCQTRYLLYLQKLMKVPKIRRKMIGYRLVTVSQVGLHDKYFLSIKKARNNDNLLTKFNFSQHSKLVEKPLMGDIFIQIFEDAWSGPKKLARINYHTYFLNPNFELNVQEIVVAFQSNEIKCNKTVEKSFTIKMQFEFYCLCHVQGSEGIECECKTQRQKQQSYWNRMVDHIESVKQLKEADKNKYFHCQTVNGPMQEKQGKYAEEIYELPRNMSNIFVEKPNVMGTMALYKQEQKNVMVLRKESLQVADEK